MSDELTKKDARLLQAMIDEGELVPASRDRYGCSWLVGKGLAERGAMRQTRASREAVTYSSSYKITDAGRASLAAFRAKPKRLTREQKARRREITSSFEGCNCRGDLQPRPDDRCTAKWIRCMGRAERIQRELEEAGLR